MNTSASDPANHHLVANTIRCLAMDAVQKARSGHPGMPMGAADFATVLWTRYLKHDPRHPDWVDRDRFVLSAGHGSMLLYALLHLAGYDLPMEELQRFRQWDSKTPGHPEYGHTAGVETTTGPLGQGFGNAVGMALAEAMLAARLNDGAFRPIDHLTYAIVSDGDLMEGVSAEAASLAGHLGLGTIVFFYDDNRITIEGSTDLAYSDNVARRFEGYHWHVVEIDGHDPKAIAEAIEISRAERERPSLIIGRTHIGKGSPNKQDKASAHGEPLGEEEVALTKKNLGWPDAPPFFVPDEVRAVFRERERVMTGVHRQWAQAVEERRRADAAFAAAWDAHFGSFDPATLEDDLPRFADQDAVATRNAGGEVLQAVARRMPRLVGGSADLAPSTKTLIKGADSVSRGHFGGRNLHFGVREHAMGAILNGMALHGGFRPYGATFLVFSDYMRPSIRLAALAGLPVIYVFTHDSIFVGEDGPTHQPVEHAAALRLIPNVLVMRPADATETAAAWRVALGHTGGPVAFLLTRQNVPVLHRNALPFEGVARGAYVIRDNPSPAVVLLATGSEVSLALDAATALEREGIGARIVSMPCRELFELQQEAYRARILPEGVPCVAIEAGVAFGWDRYADATVTMNRFGASAPCEVLAEKFGFTADNVAEAARAAVAAGRR